MYSRRNWRLSSNYLQLKLQDSEFSAALEAAEEFDKSAFSAVHHPITDVILTLSLTVCHQRGQKPPENAHAGASNDLPLSNTSSNGKLNFPWSPSRSANMSWRTSGIPARVFAIRGLDPVFFSILDRVAGGCGGSGCVLVDECVSLEVRVPRRSPLGFRCHQQDSKYLHSRCSSFPLSNKGNEWRLTRVKICSTCEWSSTSH